MNKGVGIVIVVGVIIIIIGIGLSSSESINDKIVEEIPNLETDSVENVPEESESVGTEFSVELTERIGLKSP
ncbi:hypothetical protein [Nitrosopumilus sp.]|uniref:hypothetical protein n=1 Tax=Nitrosopumilus sp. TaxID=2024843 RepID=UPI00247C3E88|nr:hypothetical protein [Nitrosopumilus sp.]MCV0430685.1 hypothetical protein [Nitrosopumilus sp.]